jgi:hypothetical protein
MTTHKIFDIILMLNRMSFISQFMTRQPRKCYNAWMCRYANEWMCGCLLQFDDCLDAEM